MKVFRTAQKGRNVRFLFMEDPKPSPGISQRPAAASSSPVCMRLWFFRFPAVVNFFPQFFSLQMKGFSPLWVLMWTCSLCST